MLESPGQSPQVVPGLWGWIQTQHVGFHVVLQDSLGLIVLGCPTDCPEDALAVPVRLRSFLQTQSAPLFFLWLNLSTMSTVSVCCGLVGQPCLAHFVPHLQWELFLEEWSPGLCLMLLLSVCSPCSGSLSPASPLPPSCHGVAFRNACWEEHC